MPILICKSCGAYYIGSGAEKAPKPICRICNSEDLREVDLDKTDLTVAQEPEGK